MRRSGSPRAARTRSTAAPTYRGICAWLPGVNGAFVRGWTRLRPNLRELRVSFFGGQIRFITAMTAPSTPRRRGRPRSERAHNAILDAATDLLLTHGLDAASMDAVAERAGVSKATIYRWW